MSHAYHFVCVDCREVIDLGKLVQLTEAGEPCEVHFGGWRDQRDGRWLDTVALHRVLERWHILHRGHEIRLVSEAFLSAVDPEGKLTYIDDRSAVFARLIKPDVDAQEDANRVPRDVADRLRAD